MIKIICKKTWLTVINNIKYWKDRYYREQKEPHPTPDKIMLWIKELKKKY